MMYSSPLSSSLQRYTSGLETLPTNFESANNVFNTTYKSGVSFNLEDGTTSPLDANAIDGLNQHIELQNKASAMNSSVGGFGEALKNELSKVNAVQLQADNAMQDYATGGDTPLHQVMLSINKAELSLQLATQVRNKLVNAYQDISRMQV
jgi:flagellar hook-basal body complex protein FliE